MTTSAGWHPALFPLSEAGTYKRRPLLMWKMKVGAHLSRPFPLGGPAGAGRPCNGFAVLHAVAAVPVQGHTIGP